jgi:ankyrin repeat protein
MVTKRSLGDMLVWASGEGELPLVGTLLEAGADINSCRRLLFNTPLHTAITYMELGVIRFLLTAEANVDLQDVDGYTARQILPSVEEEFETSLKGDYK